MKTDVIRKMLNFDPLSMAEEITGRSYKEDEDTSQLGLLLHIAHNNKKERILNEIGDTTFIMKLDKYLEVIKGFGFQEIYVEDFTDKDGRDNKLFVLYHYELGILLEFDTFYGSGVNGGKFYYNWSPNVATETNSCTSSGGFYWRKDRLHIGLVDENLQDYKIENYPEQKEWGLKNNESYKQFELKNESIWMEQERLIKEANDNGKRTVWIGYHDCRKAVISNIKRMQEYGKFFPIWIEKPTTLWLMNYSDWDKNKDKEYNDAENITAMRIARFPVEVQERIKGTING